MGLPPAIWLGARRDGHAGLAALAYPAAGVLILTILLAYSRGSILAAGVGLAVWFAVTPLRLRSATVLLPSALLAGIGAWWAFNQDGLSKDQIPLAIRSNAGTELGVLVAVLVVAAARSRASPRRGCATAACGPPRTRRAWGIAFLVVLALVPVAIAGALATTDRGLGGSISHGWTSLTDPNASTPSNDPSRLTAIGSVRARYWRDAISIFKARPGVGVGAGGYATARLRFRKDDLDVLHAHGYLVQTAADLGIAGLALTLALLAAWLAAADARDRAVARAGRARRGPRAHRAARARRRRRRLRRALARRLDVVHPRDGRAGAAVRRLARGPRPVARDRSCARARSRGRASPRPSPSSSLAVVAAWAASQPQARRGPHRRRARRARRREGRRGPHARPGGAATSTRCPSTRCSRSARSRRSRSRPAAAQAALERAVQLQPATPDAWIRLAQFDLLAGDAAAAQRDRAPRALPRPALRAGPGDLPRGLAQAREAKTSGEGARRRRRQSQRLRAPTSAAWRICSITGTHAPRWPRAPALGGVADRRLGTYRHARRAGAQRRRGERAARPRRPAARAHRDVGEPGVAQHRRERAGGEEPQVIGARVQALLERAPAQRLERDAQRAAGSASSRAASRPSAARGGPRRAGR